MDPVLTVALAAAGLFAGPKIIKSGAAVALDKLGKAHEEKKIVKAKKATKISRKSDGIESTNSIKRIHFLDFVNIKTGAKDDFRVSEIIHFDDEKDVLLRGKLHVIDARGNHTEQDIYLFQPRLYCQETLLGPKIDSEGHLSDEFTYLCKKPEEAGIYKSYVPKREALTGMRFDYVKNARHRFIERNPEYATLNPKEQSTVSEIEDFIYIELPKDNKGQFIPVDLRNEEELNAFKEYVLKHQKLKDKNMTIEEYFEREFQKALNALKERIKATKPVLLSAVNTVEEESENTLKVESTKKASTSIDEYYRRYNYYLAPVFGEKYNNYDQHHGHAPHGPHHHHH